MNSEVLSVDVADQAVLVFQDALGDLSIVGRSAGSLEIEAGEARPSVEHGEEAVHVHLGGEATVRVPDACSVRIDSVSGDLRVQGVAGGVVGQAVSGSVAVENTGAVEFEAVGSNLWARDVKGDLKVRTVGANADVVGVEGNVVGMQVGADLSLAEVGGDVDARAGADAHLRLTPSAGRKYDVAAGADLHCVVPSDAGIDLSAVGGLSVATDLVDEDPGRSWSVRLGTADATMTLQAGAGLWVGSSARPRSERRYAGRRAHRYETEVEFGQDVGRWAEDFSKRMRDHASTVAEEIADRLGRVAETLPDVLTAAGMSEDEAERIAMRVERSAERAGERVDRTMRDAARHVERRAARAEQRAAKAEERAERHARRVARHAKRRAKRYEWTSNDRRSGASQDERTAVLRMVEEGKISAADAANLLAALEGRSK